MDNIITKGDFLKFCKDFDIPLEKKDQQEVFRQKAIRSGIPADIWVFQSCLKEIFYVKECEDTLDRKRKELKILNESTLNFNEEKKISI